MPASKYPRKFCLRWGKDPITTEFPTIEQCATCDKKVSVGSAESYCFGPSARARAITEARKKEK